MYTLKANSQEQKNQKVQNDTYTNLDPKEKPGAPAADPVRNPDPNERPGGSPDSSPSQYPETRPNEVPAQEPNEIPNQPQMNSFILQ